MTKKLMDITYLGHSSFKLKGRSASLITDPFSSDMVGIKFPKNSAEIVTISHQHEDHNNIAAISDIKKIIDGPGEYEISGVSVIGVSVYHDDKKGAERGKNTIYIIEMDEVRSVHLGDIGHTLSEDIIEELGTVDILMIPVGGVYTINSTQAAEMVRAIEPNIVIPMHYKVDGMNESTFGNLAKLEEFMDQVNLTVEKLDKLSVKKSELTDDKKVVVLERK